MIALCHVRFCVPLPPPDLKAISYQSLAAVLMEGVNADAAEPVPDAQALPIGILAAHQKALRTARGGGDEGVEDGKEAASEEEEEGAPDPKKRRRNAKRYVGVSACLYAFVRFVRNRVWSYVFAGLRRSKW